MVTYDISDLVDVDFGAEFTDDLHFADRAVWFTGAVPLKFGAEFHVAKDMQLAARLEGGPDEGEQAGWETMGYFPKRSLILDG
jgi:hypothetical protein